MHILSRLFSSFITVSYAITVNNEVKELKKLLDILLPLIDKNDEVIVLQDITNETVEVTKLLEKYSNITKVQARLDGDFAGFKNNLFKYAKCQYLFQIDADEYPTKDLIKSLKPYLRKERRGDCFFVPRINTVEGITADYIKKMNWTINDKGYINFPDYQPRIIKNNKKIFWKNRVHETFHGFKRIKEMPKNYNLCLIHEKDFERQKRQNEFYETLAD